MNNVNLSISDFRKQIGAVNDGELKIVNNKLKKVHCGFLYKIFGGFCKKTTSDKNLEVRNSLFKAVAAEVKNYEGDGKIAFLAGIRAKLGLTDDKKTECPPLLRREMVSVIARLDAFKAVESNVRGKVLSKVEKYIKDYKGFASFKNEHVASPAEKSGGKQMKSKVDELDAKLSNVDEIKLAANPSAKAAHESCVSLLEKLKKMQAGEYSYKVVKEIGKNGKEKEKNVPLNLTEYADRLNKEFGEEFVSYKAAVNIAMVENVMKKIASSNELLRFFTSGLNDNYEELLNGCDKLGSKTANRLLNRYHSRLIASVLKKDDLVVRHMHITSEASEIDASRILGQKLAALLKADGVRRI